MLEIVNELQNPLIVAIALFITDLIKNQGWLEKVDSRLISIIVSALVVILVKTVVVPSDTLLAIENLSLLVLPSLGYDYLYAPIIKPLISLFRNRLQ